MNWDDLKLYLAIVNEGTLSSAAKSLSISQPTVSRRLSRLESELGVKLFQPGRSGYDLTLAGSEILSKAQSIDDDFSEIALKISGRDMQLSGTLRVTCTESMSNIYLASQFAEFVKRHPDINLSIKCSFESINLYRHEADVAIRITIEPEDTLAGKQLCDVAIGLYASLENEFNSANPKEWEWIGWQDEDYNKMLITKLFPGANIRHRVDDMQSMAKMAAEGLGVVALPCYLADKNPALKRIIPGTIHDGVFGLWILYHPGVRKVARVRSFVEFMTKQIEKDNSIFEGALNTNISLS